MVVDFVLLDQVRVEAVEKISEGVEKLCSPVGVHRSGQLQGGVDRFPLRARAEGALRPSELLVVNVNDRSSHDIYGIPRISWYQLARLYQPRACHSGMAGRSMPSVLSLPWPG